MIGNGLNLVNASTKSHQLRNPIKHTRNCVDPMSCLSVCPSASFCFRDFLQLISVPRPDEGEQGVGVGEGGEGEEVLLEYDVEWLSIIQASHHLLSAARGQVREQKGLLSFVAGVAGFVGWMVVAE